MLKKDLQKMVTKHYPQLNDNDDNDNEDMDINDNDETNIEIHESFHSSEYDEDEDADIFLNHAISSMSNNVQDTCTSSTSNSIKRERYAVKADCHTAGSHRASFSFNDSDDDYSTKVSDIDDFNTISTTSYAAARDPDGFHRVFNYNTPRTNNTNDDDFAFGDIDDPNYGDIDERLNETQRNNLFALLYESEELNKRARSSKRSHKIIKDGIFKEYITSSSRARLDRQAKLAMSWTLHQSRKRNVRIIFGSCLIAFLIIFLPTYLVFNGDEAESSSSANIDDSNTGNNNNNKDSSSSATTVIVKNTTATSHTAQTNKASQSPTIGESITDKPTTSSPTISPTQQIIPATTSPTTKSSVNPLVSVIIPFVKYQRETLLQAIYSVIEQTYENIEIIIVDDNDEGNDSDLINLQQILSLRKKNKKIIYLQAGDESLKHSTNHADSNGRNYGVNHCGGEYVAFLDYHDAWLSTKVEEQIHFQYINNVSWSTTEAYAPEICRYNETTNGPFKPWNVSSIENPANKSDVPQKYLTELHYYMLKMLGDQQYHAVIKYNQLHLPEPLWNKETVDWHNLFLTSNVIIKRDLFLQVNSGAGFDESHDNIDQSHYEFWKEVMDLPPPNPYVGYLSKPLTIYDHSICRDKERIYGHH